MLKNLPYFSSFRSCTKANKFINFSFANLFPGEIKTKENKEIEILGRALMYICISIFFFFVRFKSSNETRVCF